MIDYQPLSITRHNFYSFRQLCDAMANRSRVVIWFNGRCYKGVINGIEAEDGSGYKWNVTLATSNGSETIFVKAN